MYVLVCVDNLRCETKSSCHTISQDNGHMLEQFTGKKELFYLTTHSTHFVYCYMASDIW